MYEKRKASAPSYQPDGTRAHRPGNEAATIIPFERKRRPTAADIYQGDRFMTGVGVGACLALTAVMVVMYLWVLPAMEDAVATAQQAGRVETAALNA